MKFKLLFILLYNINTVLSMILLLLLLLFNLLIHYYFCCCVFVVSMRTVQQILPPLASLLLFFLLLLLLIVIYDGVGTYDKKIMMDWRLVYVNLLVEFVVMSMSIHSPPMIIITLLFQAYTYT